MKTQDEPCAHHANGAHHDQSFAHSQSSNGKRGADPPKEKAGVMHRPNPAQTIQREAYSGTYQEQTRSSNVSNGQHEREQSIFKIERYGKGQPYTRILNRTLRHRLLCLIAHPMVVLAYALSKGRNWQLRSSDLQEEFDWGEAATRTAMRQLVEAGFALLLKGGGGYGKACGRRWVIRESPAIPWPAKFETAAIRASNSRRAINDIDSQTKKRKTDNARARAKRKGPKQASTASHPAEVFGFEKYQDQPKPDVEAIAGALRRNWDSKPVASHPKWPDFGAWCCRQRNNRGGRGKPYEKGFWTWLAKQKKYWRDKVKEPDEQQGYVLVLDNKFYPAAKANLMLAENPKLDGKFHSAVKLCDGTFQIISDR
jgi:hypothetical protein